MERLSIEKREGTKKPYVHVWVTVVQSSTDLTLTSAFLFNKLLAATMRGNKREKLNQPHYIKYYKMSIKPPDKQFTQGNVPKNQTTLQVLIILMILYSIGPDGICRRIFGSACILGEELYGMILNMVKYVKDGWEH